MAADRFKLAGTTLEGKYRIVEPVAEGGFGLVYKATHLRLNTPVAVKVLKLSNDMDGDSRTMFLRGFETEAQTLAKLQHPAVVRVIDYGVMKLPEGVESPWMVLEWVDGEPLSRALRARVHEGGRSPTEALALLRPVFEALAEAHSLGITHRDIKPGNILLPSLRASVPGATTATRGLLGARLLDFGIAKVTTVTERVTTSGDTHTTTPMVAVSLPYAAPEQASGMRTGPWTDVHALGLLLTQVLTDVAPFKNCEDPMHLLGAVLSPNRPTPAALGFDVGPWEPVIARALCLRPADRYADAGEFLAALEANVPTETRRVADTDRDARGRLEGPRASVEASPPSTSTFSRMEVTRPPRALGLRRNALRIAVAGVALAVAGVLLLARNRAPDAAATAEIRALPSPRERAPSRPGGALPTPAWTIPPPAAIPVATPTSTVVDAGAPTHTSRRHERRSSSGSRASRGERHGAGVDPNALVPVD